MTTTEATELAVAFGRMARQLADAFRELGRAVRAAISRWTWPERYRLRQERHLAAFRARSAAPAGGGRRRRGPARRGRRGGCRRDH